MQSLAIAVGKCTKDVLSDKQTYAKEAIFCIARQFSHVLQNETTKNAFNSEPVSNSFAIHICEIFKC